MARRNLNRGNVITAILVALVVGTVSWQVVADERGHPQQPVLGDPEQLAEASGAVQVPDLEAAISRVDHVVFSASSGTGEQPKSIWVNDIGQVIEIYADGLTVTSEIPEYGPEPTSYYNAVIDEAKRASVYLATVNGVPALAVEPNTDKLGTNPGLVRIELEGISVVLSGEAMAAKDLLELANSLIILRPGTP